MRPLVIIATVIIVALTLGAAYAQQTPTEIETKAAYCARFWQLTVQATPEDQVAKIEDPSMRRSLSDMRSANKDRLNRLQSYLDSGTQSLDPVAQVAAAKRAEIDYLRYNALTSECLARCRLETDVARLAKCWQESLDKCTFGDLRDRVEPCNNLTWLPSSSTAEATGSPKQLVLTCHVASGNGVSRDFNYLVDTEKATANGFPALITDGEIAWEDQRQGKTFRSTINRYSGRITVGTTQFPALGSGDCIKNPQRAF